MVPEEQNRDDRLARLVVQMVLRGGLAVAVLLMAAGFVLAHASGRLSVDSVPLFHLFAGRTPGDTVMALGILVLTVVPAARVATLGFVWARERDWRFVVVALAVYLVLALAVVLGHG